MAVVLTGFAKGTRSYVLTLNCDDTRTVVPPGGGAKAPDPEYQLVLSWGLVPPAGVDEAAYEARIQAEAEAIAAQRAVELAG